MTTQQDRTALVTGASRGIGRGIARRLARDGALVAVHCGADEAAAKETVALVESEGGRAFALRADLAAPDAADEVFTAYARGLADHTDRTGLDVLVNNAAHTGAVAPEELTPEQLRRFLTVNAAAPLFLIQRALPLMPPGGRVVNVSSGLTRRAFPDQVAYSMSKGALEQLTFALAPHLAARGITINTVSPGRTDNGGPMFANPEAVERMSRLSPFGRLGQPEDIADVVAFVVSEQCRWITGSLFDASGGQLLR